MLRSSDQRIAEVSKLPDSARLPSGEIASARTGPPWPRNCACATSSATPSASGNSSSNVQRRLVIGWLHAERGYTVANDAIVQNVEEGTHRRPRTPALDQQKIVMFRRHRQEAEAVKLRHRLGGAAPGGAAPRASRR